MSEVSEAKERDAAREAIEDLYCYKCNKYCKRQVTLCHPCESEKIDIDRICLVRDTKCSCFRMYGKERTKVDMYTTHHRDCKHFNDSMMTIYLIYSPEEEQTGPGFTSKSDARADIEMNYPVNEFNDEVMEIVEDTIHREVWIHLGEWDGW